MKSTATKKQDNKTFFKPEIFMFESQKKRFRKFELGQKLTGENLFANIGRHPVDKCRNSRSNISLRYHSKSPQWPNIRSFNISPNNGRILLKLLYSKFLKQDDFFYWLPLKSLVIEKVNIG